MSTATLDEQADEAIRQAVELGPVDGAAYLAAVVDARPLVFARILLRLPKEQLAAALAIAVQPGKGIH